MTEPTQGKKIVVTKDGPYMVSGEVPIAIQIITPNSEGSSWEWKEGESFDAKSGYALCRCGYSKSKPFCDGSHAKIGSMAVRPRAACLMPGKRKPLKGQLLCLAMLKNCARLLGFVMRVEKFGRSWNGPMSPKFANW
jgi:CDGSH-type Zn-finger protein